MSVQRGNNDHLQMKTISHDLKRKQFEVHKLKQIIEKTEEEIESVRNELATWKSYSENREHKITSTLNSLDKTERQIRSIRSDDTLSHEEFNAIYEILTNIKNKLEFVLRNLNLAPDDFNYKIRQIEDYLKECVSRLEHYEILLEEAEMELEQYQLHQ